MEKRSLRLGLQTLVSVCLLAVAVFQTGYGQDQESINNANTKAIQLITQLSPEERVGQLFLITFDGTNANEESPIYDLITNYHVSGVVLKRANNNFPNDAIIENTYSLVRGLQEIEWKNKNDLNETNKDSSPNNFIPLFIGLSQSGDSFPTDQIITELTPLPSQMAIGATWDAGLAREAGEVLGRELSSLGINIVFGPSLDVIESPYGEGRGDLGVRTFGGDPYWVGELGKAYIQGLHAGSSDKLAVIAKNFPGRGSSDRLPDEEVATVRKSIEQLKLIELAPFFTVTDTQNLPTDYLVDGLLLSHIRYQGFQGNIRATTRPVGFDQSAVDLLMNLSPLSTWRSNGGILVSDDLGSQAVRKFFNPTGLLFDGRQIARNAFLSGNDLLYMDQLISSNDVDRYQTYKTVIDHFVQKYREDITFAEKVDAAVIRILTLKYKIYPDFIIEQVIPNQRDLQEIGSLTETVFSIISRAASLVSPRVDQISEAVPDAPGLSDRMIIFTDSLAAAQCSDCSFMDIIPVDGLQKTILKFYGPGGSGQVSNQNIISYPFIELQDYVDNPFNRPELETNLSRANWVIFLVHDQNPDRDGSYALHNLLSRKPEVLRNKTVILFSLNAPYYYDATEISSFSAFYALYSKISPVYEVIAKILFKELIPAGSSPVSVPGVAYNLINITSPDPNQVIELMVDDLSGVDTSNDINGEDRITDYLLGDNIPIRTGILVDHNNNPVPDGTVVRFSLNLQGESLTIQQVDATTEEGVARASFKLQSSGMHEIRAISEPANNSQILILDITEDQGAIISAITPTPIPTEITEEQSLDEIAPVSEETKQTAEKKVKILEWLFVSVFAWITGISFFYFAEFIDRQKVRLRISGAIVIGGLLTGYWFVFDLPGNFQRVGLYGFISLSVATLIGSAVGGFMVWFSSYRKKPGF